MKNIILISSFLLVFPKLTIAQDAIIVSGQTASIATFYSSDHLTKSEDIHIKVQLLTSSPTDSTIHFILQPNSFPNNPVLLDNDFKCRVWKKDSIFTVTLKLTTSNSLDTLRENDIAHVIIRDKQTPFFTIKLKPSYDATKPFWIEIGSNFDLIDGLKPNNLFAGA